MAVGYDGSIRIDTKIDSKGFNTGVNSISKGITRITSSLKNMAIAAGIAFGIKAAVDFGKASVKATTELTNAMTGLKSIMDGQGKSFADARNFINSYVSDGLIPATQAITAYKNLAMRGYDTSQIEQVMTALKDSAAFGRQASLTMGEAIASATEGLKNENSILVDNAGVTKNVSMMWKDYAQSMGIGVDSLTKQQKIQAEVLGIMEETRFQTGDATKIANSYSGEILRLGFNFNNLKIAIGNALIPMAQAILPSINAIISALTRLANVFAQVTTAIFGKQAKQQERVAKTGVSAAKAQDKMAEATKKAGKEAKNALADFDDLNVVTKNTADGSADATAGIDADLGLGDITNGGEIGTGVTVSPAVQTAVDTLMNVLEPLRSINFDNLNNSFDRLKKSVEPITKAVFSGLEWAYLNLLVPLATWAIEDALPVFINMLTSAFGLLNAVIIVLQPLVAWLWENFLIPIAEWTGGIIVSAIESIAEAFGRISNWIIENQELVRGMSITVGLFFGAWKLTELFAFIQVSGGVMTALNSITTAIKAATVAKIADKFETVALTVMYAKDFIVALASSTIGIMKNTGAWIASTAAKVAGAVAQTAMNIAIGLWNGLAVVATTVTTAFGAAVAFLTSPIGLVIVAAAALVAGIVLLIKHWDEVKAVAQTVWDIVSNVWGKAPDWFDKKVITPIKSGFKGFINGLITLIEGFANGFVSAVNTVIRAVNKLNFKMPDWLGGKEFGFNISEVRNVSIPKLATGAVIPPNSEFLAILGDQKAGKNLEGPESLFRKIVREETGGMGQQQLPNVEIPLYLDSDIVGKAIVTWIDEQVRRTGELPFSLGRL